MHYTYERDTRTHVCCGETRLSSREIAERLNRHVALIKKLEKLVKSQAKLLEKAEARPS